MRSKSARPSIDEQARCVRTSRDLRVVRSRNACTLESRARHFCARRQRERRMQSAPRRKEHPMRVLVTWGSERGGTEGIAVAIADVLRQRGFNVTTVRARAAPPPDHFDAAIIGGALYAN